MKLLPGLLLVIYTGIAMAMSDADSQSIYQLQLELTDQSGQQTGLDVFKGEPVIISMIYASCPHVCPLTIHTIQLTEDELKDKSRQALKVLLVTLDSENDTSERLAELAKNRKIDTSRWKLARASEDDVRKLAAVLGVRYKKLPNGEFNHTTVLTLLNREGVPVATSNQLGHVDANFLDSIASLAP
jgi:protein SCO1/2